VRREHGTDSPTTSPIETMIRGFFLQSSRLFNVDTYIFQNISLWFKNLLCDPVYNNILIFVESPFIQ
jgi:hypothetical protein